MKRKVIAQQTEGHHLENVGVEILKAGVFFTLFI